MAVPAGNGDLHCVFVGDRVRIPNSIVTPSFQDHEPTAVPASHGYYFLPHHSRFRCENHASVGTGDIYESVFHYVLDGDH